MGEPTDEQEHSSDVANALRSAAILPERAERTSDRTCRPQHVNTSPSAHWAPSHASFAVGRGQHKRLIPKDYFAAVNVRRRTISEVPRGSSCKYRAFREIPWWHGPRLCDGQLPGVVT